MSNDNKHLKGKILLELNGQWLDVEFRCEPQALERTMADCVIVLRDAAYQLLHGEPRDIAMARECMVLEGLEVPELFRKRTEEGGASEREPIHGPAGADWRER